MIFEVDDALGMVGQGGGIAGEEVFAVGDADMASDCDFLIQVNGQIAPEQEAALRALHDEMPTRQGHWARHLEGSDPNQDELKTLDGKDIKEPKDLSRAVADTAVGKEVDVVIIRKGQEETRKVTLGRLDDGDKPVLASAKSQPEPEKPVTQKALGLDLATLSKDLRTRYKIKDSVKGVIITSVDGTSDAAEKRLSAGEVIVDQLAKVSGGRLRVDVTRSYGDGAPDSEVRLVQAIAATEPERTAVGVGRLRAALGQQPFSVIVARLFELPKINREQGFAAGDAALQTGAESFRRVAARLGGVACRVSGCRIGLIAPGIEQSAAEVLAERLHDELEERITCGLGVAAWQTGESAEQMIERATRAARPTEGSLPA